MTTGFNDVEFFLIAAGCQSIQDLSSKFDISKDDARLKINSINNKFIFKVFELNGDKIILTDEGRSFYEISEPLVGKLEQKIAKSKAKANKSVDSIIPEIVESLTDINTLSRKVLDLIESADHDNAH